MNARVRGVLLVAFVVVAAIGLTLFHDSEQPHYRLSAAAAVAAARSQAGDRAFLAAHHATSARVDPLDSTHQRVSFFDGPRIVLAASVDSRGRVVAVEEHVPGVPPVGGGLVNSTWVLSLLAILFLLATAVVPLRRIRNLDVLALLAATAVIVLLTEALVAASVICGTVILCYLIGRCLWVALRPSQRPEQTPLLSSLTRRWSARQRLRLLYLLAITSVLALLMMTMTSSGYSDVAVASLFGATDILHGVLPYGHIGLVVHGDTYPILNYLVYIPGAAWLPVTNAFSDFTGALPVVAVAALAGGAAVYSIAGRAGGGGSRDDRRATQLRATIAWFSFAPLVVDCASGSNDLLLAAALAWTLAVAHRRGWSLTALATAAWLKVVPLLLLPLWLAARRRGEPARVYAGALAVTLLCAASLFALGGAGAFGAMASALRFQLNRGSLDAPWELFGVQWLQPIAQALLLGLLAFAYLRTRVDRSFAPDRRRGIALAAALLLALQLVANYWSWSYLPWVFPFVMAALLLEDAAPSAQPPIARGGPRRARRRAAGAHAAGARAAA
jgi:hypothetical protein